MLILAVIHTGIIIGEILVYYIWAISKTLGSRKGHPQIWEGPIAYHTFVQLRATTPFRPHPSCLGKINKGIRE